MRAWRTQAIPIHIARRCNSMSGRLAADTSSVKKCRIHRNLLLLVSCGSSDEVGRVKTAGCSIYSRISPAFSRISGSNVSYLPLKVPDIVISYIRILHNRPQRPSIPISTAKSPTYHKVAHCMSIQGIYCLVVYCIEWLPERLLEPCFFGPNFKTKGITGTSQIWGKGELY